MRVWLAPEISPSSRKEEFLLYGIEEDFLFDNPHIYDLPLQDLYEFVDSVGALLVQAHPYRYGLQPAPAEFIHGIEICNTHPGHDSRNDLALKWSQAHPEKIFTAGSDTHRDVHAARSGLYLPDTIQTSAQLAAYLREERHPQIIHPDNKQRVPRKSA